MTDDTRARETTLNNCPPGLFLSNGALCFKSEYATMKDDGGIQVDAYVVASGEYFWGGTSDWRERAALPVAPIGDLLARAEAAERERDLYKERRDGGWKRALAEQERAFSANRQAEAAEARAAVLRKALERIEAMLGLDNPSVIAVRAFQVAREALAADQAGAPKQEGGDAFDRMTEAELLAGIFPRVEPKGGDAPAGHSSPSHDDPVRTDATTPQPSQSEAGAVPGGPRMTLNSPPSRPELLALMEAARKSPPMTAEQIRAQRRSWVRGEMGLAHPDMSDAEINRILDEVDPPPSGEDRVKELEDLIREVLDRDVPKYWLAQWTDRARALLARQP